MPPMLYIEAIDRPTMFYIIYTMVSAQQMNLLPEIASHNGAIFAQSLFTLIQDHLAMLKFLWLCSHHSIYTTKYGE